MRTTIDIPDPIYREIRVRAASEGKTMRDLILDGVALRLRSQEAPSKQRGRLRITVIK